MNSYSNLSIAKVKLWFHYILKLFIKIAIIFYSKKQIHIKEFELKKFCYLGLCLLLNIYYNITKKDNYCQQ
jgi:hypothetical protein